MVILPRDTAVPSAGFEAGPSVRDTHLLMIASLGRMGWQEVTGYGRRALVETSPESLRRSRRSASADPALISLDRYV